MRKPGKSPSRRRRSASARVFLADELRQVRRELEEYRSELFRAEYLPQIKPFAKVRDLFERIRRDGLKIALASSGPRSGCARPDVSKSIVIPDLLARYDHSVLGPAKGQR